MKKTPLNLIHRESGARMVEFAGWEMPVQYEGALKEHQAVRERAGVFDVSHMGEIELKGRDAISLAQQVTCNDLERISEGQAQYSAILTTEGTFIDDVVLYKIRPEHLLICVNAANREKDFQWILGQREGRRVEVLDSSDYFAQLAIQGPLAETILQRLSDVDLGSIRSYRFAQGNVAGARALISRTGYTGEDGFELYIPAESAETVWRRLFEAGAPEEIRPAGLAARNTLRLEMKYALYGNDIDERHTPWEAGLGWIVRMNKADFIGRSALESQKAAGVASKLVGFEMVEPGIARDHYPVYLNGRAVTEVTSGGFSPTLQKSIGMAYLPAGQAQPGRELAVDLRGRLRRGRVVDTPFYKSQKGEP